MGNRAHRFASSRRAGSEGISNGARLKLDLSTTLMGLVLTRCCALEGLGTGTETDLESGFVRGLGSAFGSSDTDKDCR